jgi:hypothetical protein
MTNTCNAQEVKGGLRCAICAEGCTLRECAIDELGRAVHYQCLADQSLRKEYEINPRPN